MNTTSKTSGFLVLAKPFIAWLLVATLFFVLFNTYFVGWDHAGYFWGVENPWSESILKTIGVHPEQP